MYFINFYVLVGLLLGTYVYADTGCGQLNKYKQFFWLYLKYVTCRLLTMGKVLDLWKVQGIALYIDYQKSINIQISILMIRYFIRVTKIAAVNY